MRSAITLIVLLASACTSPPPPTAPPSPTAGPTPAPSETRTSIPTVGATIAPTQIPTVTPVRIDPEHQVLRLYCCSTDPRSLRPQAASGSDEISIIGGIQRGLLYRDGDGSLVPSLAAALPTISEDGLTYTYHLRDAGYSDGTPIVAGDIVRAVRAWPTRATPSIWAT